MDYETADGSSFSLQPIFTETDEDSGPAFLHTSITAFVDGKAYAGRIDQPPEEIGEADVADCLVPVPPQNIYPLSKPGTLERASSSLDPERHYLKAPSFTYDDCAPGNGFVAECFLREALVLQRIKSDPHPNLPSYLGCVVDGDGRVTQLCLPRYQCNLVEYLEDLAERGALSQGVCKNLFSQIQAGVRHLHDRFGVAHNDLNEHNVCVDGDGNAVVVDFDGCLPFGQRLLKGVADGNGDGGSPTSSRDNDNRGLDGIADLLDAICSDPHIVGASE
ncbi:hypothetical protein K431DRAFT_286099 [Polychaeton citri CBS 116435]|uniref:Protein kinase domain-containing protein n=1 Tax=Polychaeton citri CBS 116435 TaxID=1314669 RepID=A0A9P4Q8P8_9PEZI|nr:hypothetical protein K431DRAFT_286099 [Polychaeton citri CBS 116435]